MSLISPFLAQFCMDPIRNERIKGNMKIKRTTLDDIQKSNRYGMVIFKEWVIKDYWKYCFTINQIKKWKQGSHEIHG